MRNVFLGALLTVAVAPVILTIGCGGRILQASDDSSADGTATATTTTPVLMTGPPCASDSAPIPIPANIDPMILSVCTQVCNRETTCEKCASVDCMPSCIEDASKLDCGSAARAEDQCLLDHADETACGAPPSCSATYCTYANCGVMPAYQMTCP